MTASLLPSGEVLVVGPTTTGVYNPAGESWTPVRGPVVARGNHTATVLLSGEVLVIGGVRNGAGPTASAEIFRAACPAR